MFNEVPLINLNTKNVIIEIPVITSEDIVAYSNYLKAWLEKQKKILRDWLFFVKWMISFCGKDLSLKSDALPNIDDVKKNYKQMQKNLSIYPDLVKKKIVLITQAMEPGLNFAAENKIAYKIEELNVKMETDLKSKEFFEKFEYPYLNYYDWLYSGFPSKVALKNELKDLNRDLSWIKQCAKFWLSFDIWQFLKFQSDFDVLTESVQKNIRILEEYKKFPLDLYEWIHVLDRYMSEVSSISAGFVWNISKWMTDNANRFSSYVEVFVLMMSSMKTWQALIDLSADWSTKCSSCTMDSYDSYSCKLSFVCPDLPILPVPPFKIPNVFIDLSHIDLWMELDIPEFKFVPLGVTLPKLPDLPKAPSFEGWVWLDLTTLLSLNLDINMDFGLNLGALKIPSVPILPSPPKLPKLPSFLPTVTMDLPILPPAPEIPKLTPEIDIAIDLAAYVGDVMCILKWQVGLVAENAIKAKSEQLTQRTWEVPFFDEFDQDSVKQQIIDAAVAKIQEELAAAVTSWDIERLEKLLTIAKAWDAQLQWFDYKIDSYVNLQYRFEHVHAYINGIAKKINEGSAWVQAVAQDAIDSAESWVKNLSLEAVLAMKDDVALYKMNFDRVLGQARDWWLDVDSLELEMNNYKSIFDEVFVWLEVDRKEWQSLQNNMKRLKSSRDKILQYIEKIYEEVGTDVVVTNSAPTIDGWFVNPKDGELWVSGANLSATLNNIVSDMFSLLWQFKATEYKISSWVEFHSIEATLDNAAKQFNHWLDEQEAKIKDLPGIKQLKQFEWWTDELFDRFENWTQEEMDKFQWRTKEQMDMLRGASQEEIDKLHDKMFGYNNLWANGGEYYASYDEAVEDINGSLQYLRSKSNNNKINKDIDQLLSLLDDNNKVEANIESLKTIKNDVDKMIYAYRSDLQDIGQSVSRDYDGFLKSISNNQWLRLVADDSMWMDMSMSMLLADDDTKKLFAMQKNPEQEYLEMNQQMIKWYLNALDNNKAEDLNMSYSVYSKSKDYLKSLNSDIEEVLPLYEGSLDQSKLLAYDSMVAPYLLAQSDEESCLTCGDDVTDAGWAGFSPDVTSYVHWIFVEWEDSKKHNVVNNDILMKAAEENYSLLDVNADGKDDILMRDKNSVYIKYNEQSDFYHNGAVWVGDDRFYVYPIDSIESLLEDVWADNGYKKVKIFWFKFWDEYWEVKRFAVRWQSFERLKFSWLNSNFAGDEPGAYVIKFNQRVDTFYDQEQEYYNNDVVDKKKIYVLVLPKWTENFTWDLVDFEDGVHWIIDDLMTGDFVQIPELKFFDSLQWSLNLTLTEVPRAWLYARIATMKKVEDEYGQVSYVVNSPWSNQIVAGRQLVADVFGPEPVVTLYRIQTDEVVSTGFDHEPYVATHYNLNWYREDNVAVKEMWIEKDGVVIASGINFAKTWTIVLTWLFYTWDILKDEYVFGARDFNGNVEIENVVLDIQIPDIEIVDMNQISDDSAMVVAEISHDIDSGSVMFDRYRRGVWSYLSGSEDSDYGGYSVFTWDTIVTWWAYDLGNELWIYNENGDVIWEIDPSNGNVYIFEEFESQYAIDFDFSDNVPRLRIFALTDNHTLFWLNLPIDSLISWKMFQWVASYKPVSLDNSSFGEFQGWTWIVFGENVILFIWPQWQLYGDSDLCGLYSFDDVKEELLYVIYDHFGNTCDVDDNEIMEIRLKAKSFLVN